MKIIPENIHWKDLIFIILNNLSNSLAPSFIYRVTTNMLAGIAIQTYDDYHHTPSQNNTPTPLSHDNDPYALAAGRSLLHQLFMELPSWTGLYARAFLNVFLMIPIDMPLSLWSTLIVEIAVNTIIGAYIYDWTTRYIVKDEAIPYITKLENYLNNTDIKLPSTVTNKADLVKKNNEEIVEMRLSTSMTKVFFYDKKADSWREGVIDKTKEEKKLSINLTRFFQDDIPLTYKTNTLEGSREKYGKYIAKTVISENLDELTCAKCWSYETTLAAGLKRN